MENDIDTQVKALDVRFDEEYREICRLNDERIETEYTLKQRIQEMAFILEKKYTLLIQDPKELEDKLHDVCSEICNYLSFQGNEHIRSYARRILHSRFKRPYNFTKNVDMSTIQQEPEEVKIAAKECIEHLEEAHKTLRPETIGKREFQEAADRIHDMNRWVETAADQYDIRLPYQKEHFEDVLPSNPKRKTISLQAAPEYTDPKVGELAQIIIANERTIASLINKGADQLEKNNYLPEDISLLQEYIKSQEALITSLQPIANTKWLRDLQQWDKILQVQEEHGTSAASSASKIELYTDNKTGKKHYHKLSFEQISNASEGRAKEIILVKEHLAKYINLRLKILRGKELYYRCKRSDDMGKK